MRILFCNKYNFRFSGTEAYLFDVMDLLRRAGHEIALFSMDSGERTSTFPQYLVPKVDFKNDELSGWSKVRLAAHAIYSRTARQVMRKAIRDFRPDVAHVRNIYHHLSPSIFWELRAQNVLVLYHVSDFKMICPSYNLVSHGQECDRCRDGKFRSMLTERCYAGRAGSSLVLVAEAYTHKWLRTYSKCVTRFLAPTEFVRQKLVNNRCDPSRIDVLYHFQRVSEPEPEAPPSRAPILYFGRLSAEKGVTDLLRAMQQLPSIQLRIAGEGPQRAELQRLATALNLANVSFLGYLQGEQLDGEIASSRFTVFPSHCGEVLGKTILESYAQGRPVVATDTGSRRELVIDHETGLLYSPGNCEELAQKISWFCARPAIADAMGRSGRALVIRRHSPESHLATLTGIYERLVQADRRRPSRQPRVRVAFIGGRGVASKYSGIETYYEEVGRRLAEMGHEVTVYCRTYFTPETEEYLGMRVVRLPTIRTKHLETFVHTLLSTAHAAFGGYDIVHYHTLGPALFSFLPRLAGKKTVVTVQGLDWRRKKWGTLASAVLKIGERAAVWFPNATIVVSHVLQEYFASRHRTQTIYIPNGTCIRTRAAVQHLRNWQLEAGNYILFLGRFSPEKNCDLLIRAYERLETDVKLVLAGGWTYADAYTRELQSHQCDRIRLLSWVAGERLDELLMNAMLFVLPSDLEGLSLALLDAMGAGVCVLASDVPENGDLVEGAGFTFPAGDEQGLADMLQTLIADPALREKAGHAAQAKVREQYLWPDITRRIEREYLALLGWPARVLERDTEAVRAA